MNKKGAIIAIIRVSRNDCELTNYINIICPKAEVQRLKITDDFTLHRIVIKIDDKIFVDDLISNLKKFSENVITVNKNILWAEYKSCSACKFFRENDLAILSSKALNNNTLFFRIMIENNKKLDILNDKMEKLNLKPAILETYNEKYFELTAKEKEVLLYAFKCGFFSHERKNSLTDIAKSMDISVSSLSETLRKALNKITKCYIDNKITE